MAATRVNDSVRKLLTEALADDAEPFDVLALTVRDGLGTDLESAAQLTLNVLQLMRLDGVVDVCWYEDWSTPRVPTSTEWRSVVERPSSLLQSEPSRLWFELSAGAKADRESHRAADSQWRVEEWPNGSRVRVLALTEELARDVLANWLETHRLVVVGEIDVDQNVEFELSGRSRRVTGVAASCVTQPLVGGGLS